MNHSVQVLVSEKYGKHLYVGRKKHTNINVSRIEVKALPNCKPYKKLRGQIPFIQGAFLLLLFSSRLFPHIVHVINFTLHHQNLRFFPLITYRAKTKKERIRSPWLNER